MFWKQNIVAAMGSKAVLHNANIFMSHIDRKIEAPAEKDKAAFLALFKRFKRLLSPLFGVIKKTS